MIYYKNNYGQTVYLDRLPYRILTDTDLFDYEWKYDTINDINPRITRFYRNMVSKKITVLIANSDEVSAKNLTEVVEKDVINMTAGKLYVEDSYISCYFVKSEKTKWNKASKLPAITFTMICEKGSWITETTTSFRSGSTSNDGNLNYPFNYPFNYAGVTAGKKIQNESYAPSDFEMIIYGACSNPSVSIAGYLYNVNCTLETGEYLVINSIDKTVYKVKPNGERITQFDFRNRTYSVFQKIPSGDNAVTWGGLFGFDITLLSERSEPTWI